MSARAGRFAALGRGAGTGPHWLPLTILIVLGSLWGGMLVLGRVAAGAPIGSGAIAGDIERHLRVEASLFLPRPDYLLRVQGDSMIDDGILDGDLVGVRRQPTAENGQTVVARLDGEITIKRLQHGADGIRLLPRNPAYAPIVVDPDSDDFAIEGLFVGLLRTL